MVGTRLNHLNQASLMCIHIVIIECRKNLCDLYPVKPKFYIIKVRAHIDVLAWFNL